MSKVTLNDYLQASQIAHRWQECRDSVWKIFTLFNKKTGDQEYYERMKELQLVIKGYAAANSKNNTEAVIEICKDEKLDMRIVMQFLAAAYDLSVGNDHTIKKQQDDNKKAG